MKKKKPERGPRAARALARLISVMDRLRGPDGCPWDRKQTHKSLMKYALEETYELHDAIESGDDSLIVEELGDLLLQVVFHAQMASEREAFDIADVADAISNKLVERHPHVFGTVTVKDADDVIANWEAIKAKSGKKRPRERFAGMPYMLPSLLASFRIVEKAGRARFSKSELRKTIRENAGPRGDLVELIHAAALALAMEGKNPEEKVRRRNRSLIRKLERSMA